MLNKRVLFALLISAVAAPATAELKHKCISLDKSKFPSDSQYIELTSGQTHFVQGAYAVVPPASPAPGDKAMLISSKESKRAVIAIMSGKLVCDIMFVTPMFVALMLKTKTGATDADGMEL